MYPELFRIGNFPINTYGVFLAIAFLCAILITVKLAARDGLPRERIYDLSLWMLLAALVGSKVLMLLPSLSIAIIRFNFFLWTFFVPAVSFTADCSARCSRATC